MWNYVFDIETQLIWIVMKEFPYLPSTNGEKQFIIQLLYPPHYSPQSRYLLLIEIFSFKRRHPHELNYKNNSERNLSYLHACKKIAYRLNDKIRDKKCLVYAPLRGALPIWRTISQFVQNKKITVYYPVTSSFVMYPFEFNIIGKRSKPASGRFANILELRRIKPFLSQFNYFIYVDEIVSGSMMVGHLKEMLSLEINKALPIEKLVSDGRIRSFIWEGCKELITEDQKFLLGIHYYSNLLGPNIIPVLNENLEYYEEKIRFDKDVTDFDR